MKRAGRCDERNAEIQGRIEFDHVRFQYEGDSQPVLKDLRLYD